MPTPIKVLVLEDSEADARLVVNALTHSGFAPAWRRVDREVDFAAALDPSLDLIVCDFGLPGWDAMAALALTRQHDLDVPFILVSGTLDDEAAVLAMRNGATDYLLKDRLARLGPAVRAALEVRTLRAERRALDAERIAVQLDAERALRESERRFRALVEHSWDAIVLFRADGTVGYSSPSATRLLGYTEEELVGRPARDLVHPDDLESLGRSMAACVAQREPIAATARVRHRDGSYRELDGLLTNLLDDPAVGGIVGNYRDVTVPNRLAKELAESEARFRAYMTNTPVLATFKDAAGRMLYVNPAWSRWFGEEREVLGKTDDELWPDATARKLREAGRRVLETGAPSETNEDLAGHDGVLRRWQIFRFPIPVADRETLIGAIAIDITDRVRTQAILDAAQEQLRHAVIAGNVGLWDWDLVTNEVYYSPEWKQQIGYEVDEIGASFQEWESRVHPDDLVGVGAAMTAYIAGAAPTYEAVFRFRHKNGSYRHILARGSKMLGDDGVVRRVLGSNVDITARTELQAQLLQAQKMETVGQLAGGIAHDFNNLIMVINTTAELAAEGLTEGDPLREDLMEIRRAGDRSAALTRQLLAFSRKQIMAPVVLDLGALVDGLRNMLRRVIGENITLAVPRSEPGSVTADPGQLEQVIMNLVVNARDALPDGGTLTVETRSVELDDAFVAAHPGSALGPHVRLTVTDSGIGMDEATRIRVFEPFFTTKASGRGTGLGLATVHGIVHQSGGTIRVRSALGQGTSFEIDLPRVDAAPEARERGAAAAPTTTHATILMVEDELAIRRVAARILEAAGHRVLVAANGGEALLLAERHPGLIDVLFTDVVMPGMNGRELSDRLTGLRPKMKTLFTSGYTDDAILRHGVLDDASIFLAKPYRGAELTAKVRDLLEAAPTPA